MTYILGQFFGILATVAIIIVPLYKQKWKMLVTTAAINAMMALNFILIGEIGSAAFLCGVAVIQCLVSLVHTVKEEEPPPAEGVIFFLLYVSLGFFGLFTSPGFVWELNARNLLELMPIAGSIFNMLFVFVRNEHKARWFLLATCLIWSVYTALIRSTTFFAEFFTVLSTLAAMYRYRNRQPAAADCLENDP